MSLVHLARETLAIIDRGKYVAPSGRTVELRAAIDAAFHGTLILRPGELATGPASSMGRAPTIEVTGEKTATAGRRLVEVEGLERVAILNFASARNPGGGFLGGAKAQEEDLARCSALHPCLEAQTAYYEANRASVSCLYTDHLIYSPAVPFFRDDELALLEQPFLLSVITAPAPNAEAELQRRPGAGSEIEETLRRRARIVLRAAARFQHRVLVLGAWGCGAFGNDPEIAASAFADALDETRGSFDRVVFAVWERIGDGPNLRAFRGRFGPRP
jgi:uncharacterized protein (TIGR02452 family)